MKKLILLFLLFAGYNAAAQSVGIGITSPHNTAALEIRSTSKGVLMPRLTGTARQAMFSVPAGMLVYDTDEATFCAMVGVFTNHVYLVYIRRS
jgi:hypothetical protein